MHNCRSISLLSCLSEVMENSLVIKRQFIHFFEKHGIFYGF